VSSRRPRVVVLDYGSGNLRSAQRALQRAGADAEVTADSSAALAADGLVVPGVGAFAACMTGLRGVGGEQVIAKRLAAGAPVLGICVGMQILFEAGDEHGLRTAGCGCWPGTVGKLSAPVLPHMGWNVVSAAPESHLLAGVGTGEMFYFVHSYAAKRPPPGAHSSWARHGEDFLAVVEDGPLSATQFHPEKSSDAGAALLSNWLGGLR
jgi:imidazole glycerol-phosphate synthase subunit HisH